MKIIVESHIPYIQGILERAGHSVTYLAPEDFTPAAVKNADALIIRTRTHCDAALFAGSNVRIIATATIGMDHIDADYCRSSGIQVFNAPGCNAPAVAQYVLATIATLYGERRPVIGIVGVGHVGSIVNRWAQANGYPTLLCDPPLGLPATLADLAENADVITFHTPLDSSTRHMADRAFFASLKKKPLIINAARGAIVDTPALIDALETGVVSAAAIDCWEGEPEIDRRLLELASVATPHIAGYSIEGKRRATAMAVQAVDPSISIALDPVADEPSISEILKSYNPLKDTETLKTNATAFEQLRNHYDYRPEPR